MQIKNGWMAIAALVASVTLVGNSAALAAEDECLIVTSGIYDLNVSATYGNLNVSSGATLRIATGVVLTLDGVSDGCSEGLHDISGTVRLMGTGSVLRFTGIDQAVKGSGAIRGQHSAARIDVSSGLTLTNEVTIQGTMLMKSLTGTASFILASGGVVQALAGTIILDSSLNIDDEDGTLWKATDGGLLVFRDTTEMEGDFVIADCSTMLADGAEVVTTGTFLSWVGTLNCESDGAFCIDGTPYYGGNTSGGCE